MHPFLQAQLAALHQQDLKRDAADARSRRRFGRDAEAAAPVAVVIRRATAADGPALAALSALDGARTPLGGALVAEVSGAPRAVLPLDGSPPFGDPFRQTDELVALLELRAAQIRSEERDGPRGPRAWMSPAALRRFV